MQASWIVHRLPSQTTIAVRKPMCGHDNPSAFPKLISQMLACDACGYILEGELHETGDRLHVKGLQAFHVLIVPFHLKTAVR